MQKGFLKIQQFVLMLAAIFLFSTGSLAQYKDFKLSPQGDTLNAIDQKDLKQGKWVTTVGEIRGEPGYDEEGFFKDNKKAGFWRRYNNTGDIIAIEHYRFGGKDGIQQYFNFLGTLEKQEEWRGYNPDAPYDTIPIFGTASNEILEYKLVKAEQYSVPNGEWKYFDGGGRLLKMEHYAGGQLLKEGAQPKKEVVVTESKEPKEKPKTKEILEYEKKYSKKKRAQMERDGKTSL